MSETKHTPGPWVVGISSDNGIMSVDAPKLGGIEICEVWGEQDDKTITPMSTANARLIAAAPEMLVALESIAEFWNKDQNWGAMNEACWHAIETAEAAIAKAKGEQP